MHQHPGFSSLQYHWVYKILIHLMSWWVITNVEICGKNNELQLATPTLPPADFIHHMTCAMVESSLCLFLLLSCLRQEVVLSERLTIYVWSKN